MTEIEINNKSEVLGEVDAILHGIEQRTPLMRRLSGTMYSAVMQNFDAGGRPAWAGLKYRTGKPLSDTGSLRGSISEEYDNNHAVVGTNDVRAKIHQFGGTIKARNHPYLTFKVGDVWVRKKEVTIPARPFLMLTKQDEDDLLDDAQSYFRSLGR